MHSIADIVLQWYPCSVARLAVTSHGINAGDVKKLQEDGVYTCNGLLMRTKKVCFLTWYEVSSFTYKIFFKVDFTIFCYAVLPSLIYESQLDLNSLQNLCNIKGLSEAKVDKILEAAEKLV